MPLLLVAFLLLLKVQGVSSHPTWAGPARRPFLTRIWFRSRHGARRGLLFFAQCVATMAKFAPSTGASIGFESLGQEHEKEEEQAEATGQS